MKLSKVLSRFYSYRADQDNYLYQFYNLVFSLLRTCYVTILLAGIFSIQGCFSTFEVTDGNSSEPHTKQAIPANNLVNNQQEIANRILEEQLYSQSILNQYKNSAQHFEKELLKLQQTETTIDLNWKVNNVDFRLEHTAGFTFPSLIVNSKQRIDLDPVNLQELTKLVLVRVNPDAQSCVIGYEKADGLREFYYRSFQSNSAVRINFDKLLVHDINWLNDNIHLVFSARDNLSANKLGLINLAKDNPQLLYSNRSIPIRIDLQTTQDNSLLLAYEHRIESTKVIAYSFEKNKLRTQLVLSVNSNNNVLVDKNGQNLVAILEDPSSYTLNNSLSGSVIILNTTNPQSSLRNMSIHGDNIIHVESSGPGEQLVVSNLSNNRQQIIGATDFSLNAAEPIHITIPPFQNNSEILEFYVESLCHVRQKFSMSFQSNRSTKAIIANLSKSNHTNICQSYVTKIPVDNNTSLPITIAYSSSNKKSLKGIIAEAYGAYGNALIPHYSSERQSLIDQGYAVALVHVRGGNELGKDWHNQSIRSAHIPSAQDLIKALSYLQETYKIPIALWVKSAGGLLGVAGLYSSDLKLAAVLLEAPLLERSSICFSENLTALSEKIEWQELCNLSQLPSAWSTPKRINNTQVLVSLGLKDYLTPIKSSLNWITRIRSNSSLPVVMRLSSQAGHSGEASISEQRKTLAQYLAFMTMAIEKANKSK